LGVLLRVPGLCNHSMFRTHTRTPIMNTPSAYPRPG
jgi:hypothetical protein